MRARHIFPVTVIMDRYTGSYSGGQWTAWNMEANEIPLEIYCNDSTCGGFWGLADKAYLVGRGINPEAAIKDLESRMSLPSHLRPKTHYEKMEEELSERVAKSNNHK